MKNQKNLIGIHSIFPTVSTDSLKQAERAVNQLKMRKDLGFLQLAERSTLWQQCEQRSIELKKSGIKKLVLLGMGGSSLGPKAFWDSCGQWMGEWEEMIFCDNLDSTVFFRTLENLKKPEEYHFLIISKSGTTLETLAMADYVDEFLSVQGLSLSRQCTVVTELRSSPLFDWAHEEKISILEIPLDVGGRFSVLSPVGLFPVALMGGSLQEIKEGMQEVQNSTDLIIQIVAAALESWERKDQVLYFWPYSKGFEVLGAWFQQLWAESLGKALKRDHQPSSPIAVPVPSLGPRDQHSILQQVMEGPQPRWIWLLKDEHVSTTGPSLKRTLFQQHLWRLGKNMNELVHAQSQAIEDVLSHNRIPHMSLSISGVTPKTIGALFFLMEWVVGAMGEIMDINAFDQPGVELAKKWTKEILTGTRK